MDWVFLYDWQELDKKQQQLRKELNQTTVKQEMVKIDRQFQKGKAMLGEIARQIGEMENRCKKKEDVCAAETAERERLNQELYSGSCTNPKELQAMEQQLAIKDETLALLAEEKEQAAKEKLLLQKQGVLLKKKIEGIRQKYNTLKGDMAQLAAETEEKIQAIEQEKAAVWAKVSPDGQSWFTTHSARQTAPIGILKKDMCCKNCGMILPPVKIKEVKAHPAAVRCEKCGKYLIDYVKDGAEE